jgi:hypothetical protein
MTPPAFRQCWIRWWRADRSALWSAAQSALRGGWRTAGEVCAGAAASMRSANCGREERREEEEQPPAVGRQVSGLAAEPGSNRHYSTRNMLLLVHFARFTEFSCMRCQYIPGHGAAPSCWCWVWKASRQAGVCQRRGMGYGTSVVTRRCTV